MKSIELAHQLVSGRLKKNEVAVDATAGNGHDTLFLAELVGPCGLVYSLDVQKEAIEATATRLESAQVSDQVMMCEAEHERLDQVVDSEHQGKVSVVMFNLGYLPGSDHSRTTFADTTVTALRMALQLLKSGGLLTVVCYPGHSEGLKESEEVLRYTNSLDPVHFLVQRHVNPNASELSPFLISVEKSSLSSSCQKDLY